MPPVFGPVSPSTDPLEVLRGAERHELSPVRRARTAETSAPSSSSSITKSPPSALTALQRPRRPRPRSGRRRRPCRPRGRRPSRRRAAAPPTSVSAVGTPAARQHVLGEGLRPFDPGCGSARAEDGDPVSAQRVGDAGDERPLGPDHDEVGVRTSLRGSAGRRRRRRAPDGSGRARRCPGCPAPRGARSGWGSARAATRARARAHPSRRPGPSRGRGYLPHGRTAVFDGEGQVVRWSRRASATTSSRLRSRSRSGSAASPSPSRCARRATTRSSPSASRSPKGLRPARRRLPDDLAANTVELDAPGFDPSRLARSFYTTSSCGVCGKGALEAIAVEAPRVESELRVRATLLAALPDRLREAQPAFEATGGLHATGLFDADGHAASACARTSAGTTRWTR